MRHILIWLAILLPFYATAQVNGSIQKTAATGTVRYYNATAGTDTLPRATGILLNGVPLVYNSATNKYTTSKVGVAGIDTAVIRTVANSRTLAETQTALNGKVSLNPTIQQTGNIDVSGAINTGSGITVAGNIINNPASYASGGYSVVVQNTGNNLYQKVPSATFLTSGTGVTTFSGGTTGLTPSAATSGAVTLAGTLAIANGGTGSGTQNFVDLTTAQTVGGAKTFSADVQIPAIPVNATSAVSKSYIDNAITGITWKAAVKVATTVNIVLSAAQTIDGILLVAGDRVLVKNQTTQADNGIYLVAAGAWTRSLDADAASEIETATVAVTSGTINGDTQWTCTATAITLGTTAITFGQISGAGTYSASTGLTLTGNVFAIDGTVATLTGSQTLTNKTLASNTVATTQTAGNNTTAVATTAFVTAGIAAAGGVTSVTGTANQITVTGTTTPVLSIPSTFIAPGSIAATGAFSQSVSSANSFLGTSYFNSGAAFSALNTGWSASFGYSGANYGVRLGANGTEGLIQAGTGTTTYPLVLNPFGGNVSIGTVSAISKLTVRETNKTDNTTNSSVITTDAATIGVGGTFGLGGNYSGTSLATSFGSIRGGKENATDGDYAGYLGFNTVTNGSTLTERMRISSTGATTFTSTVTAPTFVGALTGNASTVTTNANLTGPITSVGNATSIASQTGTGTTFAMSASPTFTGTVTAPTATAGTNTTQVATTAFVIANAGGGVTTMAAIGAVPNANGASISGSTLTLQPAGASFGGVLTTGAQIIAGAKTLSNDLAGTKLSFTSSVSGAIVSGVSTAASSGLGVEGVADVAGGIGVYGKANTATNGTGVYGTTNGTGYGVFGQSTGAGYGGYFTTSTGEGIFATASSTGIIARFHNTTSGANILTVNPASVVLGAPIRLKGYTVATLPAGTQGDVAFVTDALAPAFLVTVAGGGAVVTVVFYNGSTWVAN